MLKRYRVLKLPPGGGVLSFLPFEDAKPLEIECARCKPASMLELLHGYGGDVLLQSLSLDSFMFILQSILLERKVVIIGRTIGVLSTVLISIMSFIRPLSWQSMFVPVLPPKLHHFLDAPVPFIVGVAGIDEGWKAKMQDAIFVYLEEDRIEVSNGFCA